MMVKSYAAGLAGSMPEFTCDDPSFCACHDNVTRHPPARPLTHNMVTNSNLQMPDN